MYGQSESQWFCGSEQGFYSELGFKNMHKSSFSVKKLLQGLGSLSFLFAKFRRNCNGKFSAKSICTYRNSENFETLAANVASKQMLKIHNGRFVIYTALHIYLPCITTESLFRSSLINCELRFLIFLLTDTRMNMPDMIGNIKNRITSRIPNFSGFFFQCVNTEFYAHSRQTNCIKIR